MAGVRPLPCPERARSLRIHAEITFGAGQAQRARGAYEAIRQRPASRGRCACPARHVWGQTPAMPRGDASLRVCVVGCGAVGSLFAANLAQLDDLEVWAYDLAQEHVDAINANGLRLSGAGDVVGPVRATSAADDLPPCDFGIVATKAMHTSAAAAATAPAFENGCVASVQNGIGNEEAIAEHVERVIRGTTFPAGRLLEPGHVQWDVKGDTTFGPFEAQPAPAAEIERLADACTRAGMPATAVADARGPTCVHSSRASSTRGRPLRPRRKSSWTTTRSA